MNIVIFEGIATSGKSSTIQNIQKLAKNESMLLYDESRTHLPIRSKDDTQIDFFLAVVREGLCSGAKTIMFDGLYLTQAHRSNTDIEEYAPLEQLLSDHNVLVAFLAIDESAIASRIESAAAHRDKEWKRYLSTRGKNPTEVAEYYTKQQRRLVQMLRRSKLTYKIYNATERNYETVATDILSHLK